MVYRFHSVWHILLKEAAKYFRVEIGANSEENEDLIPVDGDLRSGRIHRDGVQVTEYEKQANVAMKFFPAFVAAPGQFA